MYKLDLSQDRKEFANIENRKFKEEQRKSRIFNAKYRSIGVDVRALDLQIKENCDRQQYQKHLDNAYATHAIRNDRITEILAERQQKDLKELNKTLNEFRFLHQQSKDRREYDLYDKDRLKHDKPARVTDDDPRCTISTLQKFDGEDLNSKERILQQLEQNKVWLNSQMETKNTIAEREKKVQRLYELKQIETDIRCLELESAEEECRKAINIANKNYNIALLKEKLEKEKLRRIQEEDDKKTHIVNLLNSDLLTENPNQAISSFGYNRVLPDRYKGMSGNQLAKIHAVQGEQIEEKKKQEQREKDIDDLFNQKRKLEARSAILIENEMERSKRMKNQEVYKENLKLSKTHKELINYMDNELYTNQPTDAYFMQFNTCSR